MKRVYRQTYLTRSPRELASRFPAFVIENWRRLLAVLVILALALFIASCLLVISDSSVSNIMAEGVRVIPGSSAPAPNPPGLYAQSAILMDSASGRVLYEKNAHLKLPVASITKMMTALVVREQLELEDMIMVTPEATAVGEQEIWLEPGEQLSVEQLLYALLVQSANDAAFALAQYSTGSIESFARLMNKKAEKIGAHESHFTNPHGLDEPEHYSTAYDLALIGREILKDPVLAKIVATRTYEIAWPGHPSPRVCLNHNELLENYPGATGIKTGYTLKAGKCLVGSAAMDGKSLIAVALNSEQRGSDVASLLNYGFEATELVVLVKDGERLGRTRVSAYPRRYVDVVPKAEINALSLKGAGDVFSVKTNIVSAINRTVKKGNQLGKIDCLFNGQPLYKLEAVAESNAVRPGLLTTIATFLWYAICRMGRIIAAPVRIF